MMTALIIAAGIVCALIPISRIVLININRSSRYSKEYKHKAKIIQKDHTKCSEYHMCGCMRHNIVDIGKYEIDMIANVN